mmetsp:Transcript_5108/g.13797  ORF Transcript_5108/g.13797 Transcript_5108/m.13797 type:complete len:421 (-) Transcript_5108:980-2242(-)|eukprot:CAMPEP_0202358010 /NCGR_PEP_ID=MMETSP1126-20121109/11815_1 /ASSEMBLY_ACC=CAM_ASM_000457 /TAXON_ID=3047 /ORGANISM="Dunaliella tertiolecta, Strain CCMP1320" /LENGTH=420 /DNA_ID=CAMNT_0048951019 /DNA_START=71 /DNA_END=1333 /DNA_ORIENTATION=-
MGVMDKLVGLKLFHLKELWQDREVRFGCTKKELSLREGEKILESLDDVEDTKAHNGTVGKLLITNLRLIWYSKKRIGSGLSIGYSCLTSLVAKSSSSRLKGDTESLYISAKHQERDYDFVFTSLNNTAFQVYSGVAHVYSVYDKTRLYRDLNIGGVFLTDGELNRLAFEQTYSRVDGVWNLCGGEGEVGTLFISNVRVMWCSCLRQCFNMSLPFSQVHAAKVRDSKFGTALVLESSKSSGAYVWNFKVEPKEALDFLCKQIISLWTAYNQNVFFGIDTEVQAEACTEALAAEPSGFSCTSRRENVSAMDAESRGNLVENYFAHSFTSPANQYSVTSPAASSPRQLSATSATRLPARSFTRPLDRSFTRPSAKSLTSKAAKSFTSKPADSGTSKGMDREMVYWCNPMALGPSAEELNAEQV